MRNDNTQDATFPALASRPAATGDAILVLARAHADATCAVDTPDLVPAADLQHARLQRAFLKGFEACLEMVRAPSREEVS